MRWLIGLALLWWIGWLCFLLHLISGAVNPVLIGLGAIWILPLSWVISLLIGGLTERW